MRIYLAIVFLLFAKTSFAALSPSMYPVLLQAAVTVHQHSDNIDSSTYTNKLDLNLLYYVRSGTTFGVRYMSESSFQNGSESGESYGPSLGYYWNRGWFLLAHYDVYARLGSWRDGQGAQLDFGYLEHLGRHFHVGLQISDRRMTYDTDSLNPNNTVNRNLHDTYPSLTFMILF